ncbi:MAG: divalent-cation tolerance protein CutA [Planctomycetota bacterium]|nr:divalent-cation tolerance protein CutA [Planctomycetota bacterium]
MMGKDQHFFVVQVTVPARELSESLGRDLVSRKLGACVQIEGPLTSIYSWNSKLETAEEYRLVIKTTGDQVEEIISSIQLAHPYEVPEIICLPIVAGSQEYLDWVGEQVD